MTSHIHRYVEDARRLSSVHPESALSMARKAAEAVCKEVHEQKIGAVGPRALLEDLLQKLSQHSAIPRKIQVPLRTIQAYGNHASHDQGESMPIDCRYIQPALQALDTVMLWFLEEFANGEGKAEVPEATPRVPEVERFAPASGDLSGPVVAAQTVAIHGRADEIRRLCQAVDALSEAAPTAGRTLMIAGASGTGKSVLAERAVEHAISRHYPVVRATCEPFHEGMSFYPVRELLRQLTSKQGLLADIATAFGSNSSQLTLARLAEQPEAEPAARRDALIATFANQVFARVLIDRSPVVLFIDDLERIDTGSVDALLCLIARLREGPVLIVGAYRTDVVGSSGSNHPLRPVISAVRRGDKRGEIIEVAALSEENMHGLVGTVLMGRCELPDTFMRRLFEETEGNPLYVREVLRTLSSERPGSDAAPLRMERGAWRLVRRAESWEIPRSIEDAIASRLTSLGELDRSVLELAAVVGRRFRFEVLLDLGIAKENALMEVLERHLALNLVREVRNAEGVFEFTHGKIREVLYSGMAGFRRSRLHGQVADVLLRHEGAIPAEEWDVLVGAHLFAARRFSTSAPYLLRAGQRALALQAATDAAHHLARALDAFEKSPDTPRETLDRTRLALGTALKAASEFDAAEAEFLLTLRDGQDPYSRRWALSHLGGLSLVQGRVNEAMVRYAQCEEMARESSDSELLAETAADLAELHMRQSEQLSGVDGVRSAEHAALYNRYLDLEQELAHSVGHSHSLARAYRNSAKRARTRGDIAVSIALYEQSLEYIDEGVNSHRFLIPYAKALRLVSRDGEALEIVRKVLDWSRQIGARRSEGIARQYLGLILMEQELARGVTGLTQARAEMTRALALHNEVGFEQGRRETEVDLAEAYSHCGDREGTLAHLGLAVTDRSSQSDEQLVHAVLAEIRARGEPLRAERFGTALSALGVYEAQTDSSSGSGPAR